MGLPPGDDLDGRDDFGGDVVRDEVRQTFIFLQDVRDALDSLRAILDSNKQSASGGIGERHEGLQRAFRGRKVALELERLALRPTEKGDQIHALHFTLMRSRNQSFRAGALTKGSPSPTARPAHGKQSIQIAQIRTNRAPKHCEEICAPALSKWMIIVSISIAIGEEEGYDPSWYKCTDFHTSLQADSMSGYRVSLAHGWSSGIAPWLMEQIIGIVATGPGFSTVNIRPDLIDLQWAKGAEPTPRGILSVGIRKNAGYITTIDLPPGTEEHVSVPVGAPKVQALVNGKPEPSIPEENGKGAAFVLRTAGHYEIQSR